MDFDKMTEAAVDLTRHLFTGQGHIHAFALFDQGESFGMYQIAEGKSDTDAVARFNKVVRDNDITAYAAVYEAILPGSDEEEKMLDEGGHLLDHVTPVKPLSLAQLADISVSDTPSKVLIIVLASKDGERKTLLIPVTGDRSLGPEEDMTDHLHSPFSEVFGIRPPSLRG